MFYVFDNIMHTKSAPMRIGSKLEGYTHVSDWYKTFCALAGVNAADERAAAAGVL